MTTPPHTTLAFRSDAGRLAMSAPNGDLTLWNTESPGLPRRSGRLRHRSRLVAAAWNPFTASSLVTASQDGSVLAWHLTDNRPAEPAARWTALVPRPRHVGWVANGRRVFSVTADGHAFVWDVHGRTLLGHGNLTEGRPVVAAHHSGTQLAVVVDSGWARLWEPGQEPEEWIRLTGEPVTACARSENLLAIADDNGYVACFDTDLRRVGTLRITPDPVRALACLDDGHLLAAYPGGRLVAFGPDGSVLWRASSGGPDITSIAVAGKVVAVGGVPAQPTLLCLATGMAC